MKRSKKFKILIFILFFLVASVFIFAKDNKYISLGEIESLSKGSRVSVIFFKKPKSKKLLVIEDRKIIGKIRILSISKVDSNLYSYRAICNIAMNEKGRAKLKVGLDISSYPFKKKFNDFKNAKVFGKSELYLKKIILEKDKREMVLIPEGKFYLGSDNYENDEKPLHVKYLKDFYIDKYEVSNNDYYRYIKATEGLFPKNWVGKTPNKKNGDLPVLVSYKEAERYSKWAGKRLPTEEEWEKAAKGLLFEKNGKSTKEKKYPWGRKFNKKNIKNKLVSVFSIPSGQSNFGVFHLADNAMEWTASWYISYENNKSINIKFGKQYKVVRGGAWYTLFDELRVTKRVLGGIPNLYEDSRFGFRCVKDVTRANLKK